MGVGNSARRGDSHITSAWPLGTKESSWPPKTLMAARASAVSTSQASSPWYCPLLAGQRETGGHRRSSRRVLQCAQDTLSGAAIGIGPAQALRLGLDRTTRGDTDHAVGSADVVATGQQQGLQLAALIAADAGIIGRPRRGQAFAAPQLVGQRSDRQRIAFGSVVAVDRVVVAEHQQRRALAAGRQQQGGACIGGQCRRPGPARPCPTAPPGAARRG
ncbi:hypothetical protein G6F50_014407 [Rhizopus delemar]|uniref:Uncharacterized protein n=1 Tax=Rhizopus delemar TaxID=936053 RepID=A0A9P6Y5P6_9FUNG|nr:hypothetical protein G6F50_014407 [Rhizopus delemar]